MGGVLGNSLEFYLVTFPNAVQEDYFSPFAYGKRLRIERTCTKCFPYLGLWEAGWHLGFGSKHINASHLTKEFGFGLTFFSW